MMVAVRAVHVAVGELFRRRRTHAKHRAAEAQPLPSERMIAVDHDLAVGDVGDGVDDALLLVAVARPSNRMPTSTSAGKRSRGSIAHQVGVVFAEARLRARD